MASTAVGRQAIAQAPGLATRRAPIEGWVAVLLHAALLVVMAEAIGRVEQRERLGILVPLALGGGLIGLTLFRRREVVL